MIEKLIVLEDIDPVIFYGVNNANMQLKGLVSQASHRCPR